MASQRERFERTDVPQPSHTRTVVSAVVVVVVFAALFISLSMFWNKADSYSTYNDSTLEDAVDEAMDLIYPDDDADDGDGDEDTEDGDDEEGDGGDGDDDLPFGSVLKFPGSDE